MQRANCTEMSWKMKWRSYYNFWKSNVSTIKKSPSSISMIKGVPPEITAAPLEARVFPYGDAVTAGETLRNNTADISHRPGERHSIYFLTGLVVQISAVIYIQWHKEIRVT